MTRIAVLLPYRARGAGASSALREAMESVLADLDAHDELVAIDDGSDEEARHLVEARASLDARVIAIATDGSAERPAGIVAALTLGLGAARGDLVGRMDADDISLPGRFAAQRALLDGDPELGAVGAQVELFPAPGPGMQRYVAWQNTLVSREDHARAIFVESPLCHPSTLLRRTALDAVGGYREMAWATDYDLWLRLDAAGWGLAKVPRVLFRWRISASSMTWTHPKNAPARFVEARACFLAPRLGARVDEAGGLQPFLVWGAGQTGRRLARALEAHGLYASAFVDIDPRKVGRTARGAPIIDAAEGIERARAQSPSALVVVAVGEPGARDLVRARLASAGLREGESFVCAA